MTDMSSRSGNTEAAGRRGLNDAGPANRFRPVLPSPLTLTANSGGEGARVSPSGLSETKEADTRHRARLVLPKMSTINPMPSKEDILFDGFARKRTSTGTWKEVYLVLTSDCLTVARDQSKKVSAQRAYEGAWTSEIARGTGELPEQMVVIDRIALVDIAWCHSGSNIRTPQVGPRPGHRVIKLEGGEGDDTQQGDASFCGDGQDSVDSPSSVLQDQQTFELLTNGSKSVQKGRKFVFQTRTVLESREWIEKIKSSVEEKKATVQRQLTLEMTPWTRYLHICKFIHESQSSEKYMETGVLTTSSQAEQKQYLSIHHATFHNLSIASLLK